MATLVTKRGEGGAEEPTALADGVKRRKGAFTPQIRTEDPRTPGALVHAEPYMALPSSRPQFPPPCETGHWISRLLPSPSLLYGFPEKGVN